MCARLATLLVLGTVAASAACGGSPTTPSTPPIGAWGGDHMSLTVTDTGSHAEFDCAHGEIPNPWVVDSRHAFSLRGTFVRDRGGPILVGEPPDSHPADYFGSVTGDTMTLTVMLADSKDVIGTFTLIRGAPARVVKCLLPLVRAAVHLYRPHQSTVRSFSTPPLFHLSRLEQVGSGVGGEQRRE